MALEGVISCIGTCKNMYEKFQAAYDVCSKVVTNFREQRRSLKEEADFLMNDRVKNIAETISNQPEDNLKELQEHLENIGKVFAEIVTFLEEVKETKSSTVITFLKTLIGQYRGYQQRFKDFTEKLNDLEKKLDQLVTDVIPKVFDLQRQLLAQLQDMQRDMKELRKLIEKEKKDESASVVMIGSAAAMNTRSSSTSKQTLTGRSSKIKRKSAAGRPGIEYHTRRNRGNKTALMGARLQSLSVASTTAHSNELSEIETLLAQVEMEGKNEIELELKSIR